MQGGLGDWIRRKLKSGVIAMTDESNKILASCGVTDTELREQWKLQVEAQISLRARKFSFVLPSNTDLSHFRCSKASQEGGRCRPDSSR